MGNGSKRNDPCICGSGKKFKNCCINKGNYIPWGSVLIPDNNSEPFLNFVPSVEFQGRRVRVIWNTIYYRPLAETFSEFIIHIAYRLTYGKEFHDYQVSLPIEMRHITFKWWMAYCDWGKKNSHQYIETEHGRVFHGDATGEVRSLVQHAYDLFCLQTVNRLPKFLVDKLRDKHEFQGARYEVAVAAIIARAGFDIEFLDEKHKSEKHCEFIATHRKSGQKIGVEAKSKRRKGILHEDGEFNKETDFKGNIQYLFRKARTQKPENMPYIIFIDMNLPSTNLSMHDIQAGIEPEKTWEKDIDQIYDNYRSNQAPSLDPFNAIYFTNFAFYYYGNEVVSNPWVTYIKKSDCSVHVLSNNSLLDSITNSIARYAEVPSEI